MKYICPICGYVYDENKEKLPFSQLPDTWKCPVCKAPKSVFTAHAENNEPPVSSEQPPIKPPIKDNYNGGHKFSAGELSALCSSLARGCEKQYEFEQASLFSQLAEYFAASAASEPEADINRLASLMQEDLKNSYPAMLNAAKDCEDRGAQRVITWGEKVTNMLRSLIEQYLTEGEALLGHTQIWVCSVCGFVYIGDAPPELCPVCKVPAWKFEKIEGREPV